MRIFIDEKPCDLAAGSIEEAIAAAAAHAGRSGRVIVEIAVDGTTWSAEQLESHDLCGQPAGEVQFVSADMSELVCQTLSDAGMALTEADALQREAATLLQADQPKDAMEKLGGAIEIWMTVHEAVVKSAEALSIDLEQLAASDRSVQASIDQLNALLHTVRSALSDGNTVGLSDSLLYEFPEVVAEWRELLTTMQRTIQPEHG